MSAWEYKFITSGKGGFATPALMETFLNQLGQEEWEILYLRPQVDNPLAFSGLARRSTQREWTLASAVTAAAKAEADKLRAEFEAKFKGVATTAGAAAEEPAESPAAEPDARDYRKIRDTESDLDPELADEDEPDEWDKIAGEDELPTFFEAIQPLMRRNQRGGGVAVAVDHLAKKWSLSVEDVVAALKECGFTIPEDEDERPSYLEYDGDLFWVNVNRRGELWVNSREKPRPVFRVAAGRPVGEDEAAALVPERAAASSAPPEHPPSDGEAPAPAGEAPRSREGRALPEGEALLQRIRPLMRRERGGGGRSGSIGFLARALKCRDNELVAALGALGLKIPAGAGEISDPVELGGSWSVNRDHRGGIWIHQRGGARKDEPGENGPAWAAPSAEAAPAPADLSSEAPAPPPSSEPLAAPKPGEGGAPSSAVLAAARLLLKPTRTGAFAAEVGRLAESVGKSAEELTAALVASGLVVPEKPREKPVFVEQGDEIFWLNRNGKGELWLNAKASKYSKEEE